MTESLEARLQRERIVYEEALESRRAEGVVDDRQRAEGLSRRKQLLRELQKAIDALRAADRAPENCTGEGPLEVFGHVVLKPRANWRGKKLHGEFERDAVGWRVNLMPSSTAHHFFLLVPRSGEASIAGTPISECVHDETLTYYEGGGDGSPPTPFARSAEEALERNLGGIVKYLARK